MWAHYNAPLFGLAPGGVYPAAVCCHLRGALLPHLFTLTELAPGGIFSVALAVGSHPPGVTWHPAQWSPDFPPGLSEDTPATTRPTPTAKVIRALLAALGSTAVPNATVTETGGWNGSCRPEDLWE